MTRFITKDEALAWLERRGMVTADGEVDVRALPEVRVFHLPDHPGVRLIFARILAWFFKNDAELLLYVEDWGNGVTEEDWNLVNGFRRGLGEAAELSEKPGHLFSEADYDDLVSILCLVLLFSWGAYLVASNGRIRVRTVHEDLVWLQAAEPGEIDEAPLARLDHLLDVHKTRLVKTSCRNGLAEQ